LGGERFGGVKGETRWGFFSPGWNFFGRPEKSFQSVPMNWGSSVVYSFGGPFSGFPRVILYCVLSPRDYMGFTCWVLKGALTHWGGERIFRGKTEGFHRGFNIAPGRE